MGEMSKRLLEDYNSLDLAKGEAEMAEAKRISRRQFIGSAAAVAVISAVSALKVFQRAVEKGLGEQDFSAVIKALARK